MKTISRERRNPMHIDIYSLEQQGVGQFDGGNIVEQKPIGFSGEGSVVKRVGPLFYWAWMHAKNGGTIPKHPHQAFEIMTYLVQGKAKHRDSLGTESVVGTGGAQVMQAGSGLYHEEALIGPDMEGFQIWFEPHLNKALRRNPTYKQYEEDEFPVTSDAGYQVKMVIGEGFPVQVETDVKFWDVTVKPGAVYPHLLPAGRSLATLVIRGGGAWKSQEDHQANSYRFQPKDFVLLRTESEVAGVFQAEPDHEVRLIMIEVPSQTPYPLYRKER
ncbi:pirin family protein [Salinithrix halophila]|uniref:Pirin family protein n=1 Tax=Salinithrix halophila TaxID=1485204 RepID=A0ABV8JDR3_9BACL